MSQIVYQTKGLALASGLKWPVMQETGNRSLSKRRVIRAVARDVRATRYLITQHDDGTYIGLYSPDELQRSVKGEIHSLALVFLNALLDARSQDRSMINAVLAMSVAGDHIKRAVVIINDGHIVHDHVEPAARVHELTTEQRLRLGDALQVFSSEQDIAQSVEVSWEHLIGHANKLSRSQPVPGGLALPLLILAVGCVAGAAFAYHQLITIPAQKEEQRRKAAAADRTGEYVRQMRAALQSVGWDKDQLLADAMGMRTEPYFVSGWALKSVSCSVEGKSCTEDWERVGGNLKDLIAARPKLQYVPQESAKDAQASLSRVLDVKATELTPEHLPEQGTGQADMVLRPIVNELVNAGVRVQISEAVAWPPVPLQGVSPAAIIKRRQVSITADYHLIEESIRKLPLHVVPHSYTLATASNPMTVTVVGHAYLK